jgi:uncharacterized protein
MKAMTHETAANRDALRWHDRLLRALMQGDAFDTPPAERRLVQTHISSVLLIGAHAYKLRKPLRLPFLDFSTLASRRADCEEELRLNRRTAAALYQRVLPVTGSVEAPRIGGAGEPIDWLLQMQRFDPAQQLDHLADAGQLDAALVDALAAQIGRFHAALPPSAPEWGQPETVRAWALDNFETLQGCPDAAPHAGRLAALHGWTVQACSALTPMLAARHAQGWVREGHGDLHLGNIVQVDGQPWLFDALEFNPALRHTDIVADIAFSFMDLQRRGLPGLAWRLVNGWADVTGDHAGLALLHFFATYRAMVRAKVALLRGAQGSGEARAAAVQAFERDLALAERLAAPRHRPPRLVLTSGLSGSGKSTLAAALLETLGAVRIRSDVERKRLFGMAPTDRADAALTQRLYGADATRRTFDRLAALAATLLAAGLDVVVDATFGRRPDRDRFRALAATRGASFTLVECTAPEAVLRRRLAQRQQAGHDASDADGDVLSLQLAQRAPLHAEEEAETVDTDLPPGGLQAVAQALVRRWRAA